MKATYRINEVEIPDESGNMICTYGIEAVDIDGGGQPILTFTDLFASRAEAEAFAERCNAEALSPVHLKDVIEDHLGMHAAI